MFRKLFVLVVLLFPLVLSVVACGDGGGDNDPQPTPVDLVQGLEAVGEGLEGAGSVDPGMLQCINAQNCLRSGMQCDVNLFARCKDAGRVNGEPLPEYTQ